MTERQLIEDLLSALEYHTEQTRPIQFSRVAIEAAREHLRKPEQPTQQDIPDLIAGALGVSRGTAYDMMREALAERYAGHNPLGGPAKVFDAMAAAIRAGDSYGSVLRQYGFLEAKPAQQEPVAWNVIDPLGKVVATETNAVRGWARIDGYKPTVEGLLGFHEKGWRVVPTAPQPPAQQEPKPIGKPHRAVMGDYGAKLVNQRIEASEAKLKEKNT